MVTPSQRVPLSRQQDTYHEADKNRRTGTVGTGGSALKRQAGARALFALLLLLALLILAPPAQATTTTIIAGRDSYLKLGNPNDTFANDVELLVKEKSGDQLRAVYHFALSSLPAGESVTSATLKLFVTQSTNTLVNVHRIIDSWTESGVTCDPPLSRLPAFPRDWLYRIRSGREGFCR
jgi:hypothetical protein